MIYDSSKYDKPSVTVDTVLFSFFQDKTNSNKALKVLLVKRGNAPFKDQWCLPGSFLEMSELPEQVVKRSLKEKASIRIPNLKMEQLYTFYDIKRDPRMRILSIAYIAITTQNKIKTYVNKSSCETIWAEIKYNKNGKIVLNTSAGNIPLNKIAFDHMKIITLAVNRIINKIEYTDIAFNFIEEEFTLTEVQNVYEGILYKKLEKSNFRKFIKKFVISTGKKETEITSHRPSELYSINPKWNDIFWR